MEVSYVIDEKHVQRARERASMLRDRHLRVAAAVAGTRASEEVRSLAALSGVVVVLDGAVSNAQLRAGCWCRTGANPGRAPDA